MVYDHKLYLNGIDGTTGQYLVSPLTPGEVATLIKKETQDPMLFRWLKHVWRIISQPHLGLPLGVDPADVRQAGWAVVFHTGEDEAVKKAIEPLIEHRQRQIGDPNKVKVLTYRSGESQADWLARHKVSSGTVEPTKVPYYLLLVGSPAQIPFSFGQLLDVEYAVGRLHFDRASQYANYVASLVDYETSQTIPNAKEAVFFAPRHPFEPATQLSADLLVNPLADGLPAEEDHSAQPGVAERWAFRTRKIWGETATKAALIDVLAPKQGRQPPAFLFTASHGVGWPRGDAQQKNTQGALLCQDWPGFGCITADHYFSAGDLPVNGRLHGIITFHFACYSAGTPTHDRFIHKPGEPPPQIADEPFIAALPKALLSFPIGGVLACVGHVDRAWGCSIRTPQAGPQLLPFQNAISRILIGQPVGHALKDFNERYAALSTGLSSLLEEIGFDPNAISNEELVANWIKRNDAEGYMLVGDPAAQLRVHTLS